MKYPRALEELIISLKVMPGIGHKTAQRIAFELVQKNKSGALRLANSLKNAIENIQKCRHCRNLSDEVICEICQKESRKTNQLCVVETPTDLSMIENSNIYKGRYFVLMGHLSPIDGIGPNELGIKQLIQQINNDAIEEVILATNATIEGDSTAFLIREMLKGVDVKLTRIAQGVPLGGELEMVDTGTIQHAFKGRQIF
jgi:recombination protein RecR